jgi:hypothetical protein
MTALGAGLSKVRQNFFDFGKSKSLKQILSLAGGTTEAICIEK